jgi:hypothetical protein
MHYIEFCGLSVGCSDRASCGNQGLMPEGGEAGDYKYTQLQGGFGWKIIGAASLFYRST